MTTGTEPVAFATADTRALAAALEGALNWLYARDMGAHIKLGVPPKSGFCAEYVNDINAIRKALPIARKLGCKFKSLEIQS